MRPGSKTYRTVFRTARPLRRYGRSAIWISPSFRRSYRRAALGGTDHNSHKWSVMDVDRFSVPLSGSDTNRGLTSKPRLENARYYGLIATEWGKDGEFQWFGVYRTGSIGNSASELGFGLRSRFRTGSG